METVRKIRAVLFDMDGVLIDTEKYLTRFWRQAAAEAGLLLSLEECYAFRSFAGKYAAPGLPKNMESSMTTGQLGSGERN